MQALQDIFSIWGGISGTATALNEKKDTVYRWLRRGRIPDRAWLSLIAAAERTGKVLTVGDLHGANRPAKPRGTHKTKPARKRRAESRAVL